MPANSEDRYKESIRDTKLKVLKIKYNGLYNKYPQIDYGQEASVYRYNTTTALKIFNRAKKELLSAKYKKIEAMIKFSDPSFCFPKGLVTFEDGYKEGIFLDLVVKQNDNLGDFEDLTYFKDTKKLIEYLVKAETAMDRIHKQGIIIGDVKTDNIMIDINDNPIFVDTDNYAFEEHNFNLYPSRRDWFKRIFKKDCSDTDSDKFLYSMMSLQYFTNGTLLYMADSKHYFDTLIKMLKIDAESKEILKAIFSDSVNKPSISPVLQQINTDEPIIDREDIYRLNRI